MMAGARRYDAPVKIDTNVAAAVTEIRITSGCHTPDQPSTVYIDIRVWGC